MLFHGTLQAVCGTHHAFYLLGSHMKAACMGEQLAVQVRDGRTEVRTKTAGRYVNGGLVCFGDSSLKACKTGREFSFQTTGGDVDGRGVCLRYATLSIRQVLRELRFEVARGQQEFTVILFELASRASDFVKVRLDLLVCEFEAHVEFLAQVGKSVIGQRKCIQVHVTGEGHIEITGTVPLAGYLHLLEFGTGI